MPGRPAPTIGPGTVISIVLLEDAPAARAEKLNLVVTEYGVVMAIPVLIGPNVAASIGPTNVWLPSDVTVAPAVVNVPLPLSCQAASTTCAPPLRLFVVMVLPKILLPVGNRLLVCVT